MFGTLRLLLAFMVVLSHLPGSDYLVHFGMYAVCGFFVLSGFLMTAGLHEVYRFDAKLFWANRLLRLLPPFYLVCLLTLLVVIHVPAEAGAYMPYWVSDVPRYDIALNLLIIPQQYPELGFRLVPPFWSVAVELQMYALLFFVASRNETSALATLWIGGIYHLACIDAGLNFGARYFLAASATLSFAAGTLIYFWTKRGVLNVTPSAAALAFVMWLANTIVARWLLPDDYTYGPGYYFATFLFVILVAGLAKVQWAPLAQRIDRMLGEIAYPVFLVQWLAAFLTALAISPGIWRGWTLTFASIPLILLMAIGITLLNGKLIEPLRRQLRSSAAVGRQQEIAGREQEIKEFPLRSA